MPTLVLQFYILLIQEDEYSLSVMLSMSGMSIPLLFMETSLKYNEKYIASAISVTFTLLRVLYGDHHSMSREQDLSVGILRLKSKKTDDEYGNLRFSR